MAAYFLRRRGEKATMAATLMPAFVIVVVLMSISLPGSLRPIHPRPH